MQLAAARTLTFTDATGKVIITAPIPNIGQVMDCIALDAPTPKDGAEEPAVARQRRYLAQCLVLLTPPPASRLSLVAWVAYALALRRHRAWLRTLQYPQLIDLYRKLMLCVQGIDFDTVEEFERALEAQKKSTVMTPPSPAPTSSPESASSSSASPSTSTPCPA